MLAALRFRRDTDTEDVPPLRGRVHLEEPDRGVAEEPDDRGDERLVRAEIDTSLWAVMRYPKTHPVAMIIRMANRDNVPLFFVQTWHPEPSRRRVISQHDTIAEASASVLWDLEKVNVAGRTRVGPPNGVHVGSGMAGYCAQ